MSTTMDDSFATIIERCRSALEEPDAQGAVEAILLDAASDPAVAGAIATRIGIAKLEDLAIYRSPSLTLLAAALPPGFSAGPHNHNLWSVVAVCGGQEDNRFFERRGDSLEQIGAVSVVAPGVLPNDADVIHSISNPLDTPLLALHAYGGDLFAIPRSHWDSETHEEIPFDWQKISSKSDNKIQGE